MISNIDPNSCFDSKQASFLEVASDYVQTRKGTQKLIIEPTINALNWAECRECISETADLSRLGLKKVNHIFGSVDFPTNVGKLSAAIQDLASLHWAEATLHLVGEKSLAVFTLLEAPLDFCFNSCKIIDKEQLIQLTPLQWQVLNGLGLVSSLSLFVGTLKNVHTEISVLSTLEYDDSKFNAQVAKVVSKICLLGIATFGMISFYGTGLVSREISLAVTSLFLATGITAYFLEKIPSA